MKNNLLDRLLRRELGSRLMYAGIKGIYGERTWIDELDIIDELGGHTGCVNALSWSSSGRLLASGSDDLHINIHSYQPESFVAQFALNTTVLTGHTENIFSVKFMPGSNDSTLVTCAGDCQVRVFDLEHSSRSAIPSTTSNPRIATARRIRLRNLHKGVRYLGWADTGAKTYKSHVERVKRIVTESSPYLFLTCSEDGEVRQFDLRLPSSAYPAPSGGRGVFGNRNHTTTVPPPLISYKRYQIDLNTISCSPSQPHYIALGGSHLHCFLHDRRMIGRDHLAEIGNPGSVSPISSSSSRENDSMGQATRCVRKFAPNGQKQMQRTENGHITACKISDACPNEMIVSWSGDHIYSFDIVHSPGASESESRNNPSCVKEGGKGKARESRDRKRKRVNQNSSTSIDDEEQQIELRVRYENGQSEDIPVGEHVRLASQPTSHEILGATLNDSLNISLRIAHHIGRIKAMMFSIETHRRDLLETGPTDYRAYANTFTSILGIAVTYVSEMDNVIRSWQYPMNPSPEVVFVENRLRRQRSLSRQFVQAAGTLARVLGGQLQTVDRGPSHLLQNFDKISPVPELDEQISQTQIFGFEFLRAIVLWLQGGTTALLQGFRRPENQRPGNPRFPVPVEADSGSVDDYIIPYLLELAQDQPVVNVDASRFEIDENRRIFENEIAAVIAFSHAVKTTLDDRPEVMITIASGTVESRVSTTHQQQAMNYWGLKIGRSLLMKAGEGVSSQMVDEAFGGVGRAQVDEGRLQDDIYPDEMEDVVEPIEPGKPPSTETGQLSIPVSRSLGEHEPSGPVIDSRESAVEANRSGHETDGEAVSMEDPNDDLTDQMSEDYDENEDEEEYTLGEEEDDDCNDDDDDDEDVDDDDDDDDDDDEALTNEGRRFLFQSKSTRSHFRKLVAKEIPCSSHHRSYRGHCNIKTVKDANYFGLQDDYVVSGSDSGHVFIWDKKTSELVNILKGDEEVVNVIQGHPYEPVLAVSGIDDTIKIFSPDGRAQHDATNGVNISQSSNDSSGYISSTRAGQGLSSRKQMQNQYAITNQNDMIRHGGIRVMESFFPTEMFLQLAEEVWGLQ